MHGINKVILVGSCGKDPETRYTPSGVAVTNISVATNESWKDKNTGEKQEHTEWHNVVFFGKVAEIAGEYLKKGKQVYIEGKLKTESYEKDGVTRYSTKIIANEMQMLCGRDSQAGNTNQGAKPQAEQRQPGSDDDSFESDLPF